MEILYFLCEISIMLIVFAIVWVHICALVILVIYVVGIPILSLSRSLTAIHDVHSDFLFLNFLIYIDMLLVLCRTLFLWNHLIGISCLS